MPYFRSSLNFEQNSKVHISGRQKAESNKRPFSNRSPKKVHKLLLMISIRATICIFVHEIKRWVLIKVVNLGVTGLVGREKGEFSGGNIIVVAGSGL